MLEVVLGKCEVENLFFDPKIINIDFEKVVTNSVQNIFVMVRVFKEVYIVFGYFSWSMKLARS